MKTSLLFLTAGLLISSSSAASIANLEAKRLLLEEGLSNDRENSREMDVLYSDGPSSVELSDKVIEIPPSLSEVEDIRKLPLSTEVLDEDQLEPLLSSEVSENLGESPKSSELADHVPLASSEVSGKNLRRSQSSQEAIDEDGRKSMSFSEVLEDPQKSPASSENPEEDQSSPVLSEVSENDHRQPRSSPIIEEDRRKLIASSEVSNLRKSPISPKLSDKEIQIPLASSEVSESDHRQPFSSPEVVEEDSRKSISSSEVSEGLRNPPASPKLSDEETQIPLASSEVSEENFPRPSPEVPKKDLNDEFYQNMAFAMEKAAQEVLRENADVTSSSEVSEDPRKLPVSLEIPEKDLQKLFDFFRYIASALTNEEYSSKLKDSYPVWDVISSLLKGTYKACENSQTSTPSEIDNSRKDSLKWWEFIETTKRPSKTVRKESQEDIGDWWKYIPDVKQESPREEPMDDVDDGSRYLSQEKPRTKPQDDNDDDSYKLEGNPYPRRKIVQYWTRD